MLESRGKSFQNRILNDIFRCHPMFAGAEQMLLPSDEGRYPSAAMGRVLIARISGVALRVWDIGMLWVFKPSVIPAVCHLPLSKGRSWL
ncbi:hypothetical protein [Sinomicrobium sp.]